MEASELDFTSSSFNPLKALYTDGLQPPVPNVQIFNNINEYAQCIKLGKPLPKRGCHVANIQGSSGEGSSLAQRLKNIADNKLRSRNRDPSRLAHLMKVKSKTDGIEEKVAMLEKTKQRPRQKNVLERMELDQHREGPLRILYNCIEKKVQLKVWTRRLKGLRGVCVGYLIAYDKHLNLAMMDVDEMFAIEEEVELDPTLSNRIEKKKEKKRNWRRMKRKCLKTNKEMNDELNQESIAKTQGDSSCGEILDIVQSRIDEPQEQNSICSAEQDFEFNLSTPIPANSSNVTKKGEFDSHALLQNGTNASRLDVMKDENKEMDSDEGSSTGNAQKLFTAKVCEDNTNPNDNHMPTNERMGLATDDPQEISGDSLNHSDMNGAVIKDYHDILSFNSGIYCPNSNDDGRTVSDCESSDEEGRLEIWEGRNGVEGTMGDIGMKKGPLWDHGSSSGSSDDEEVLLRIWQEGHHDDKGGVTTHSTQMKEEVQEELRQEQTVCNPESRGSKNSDQEALKEGICDKETEMMMQDILMVEEVTLSCDESSSDSDNDEEVMLQIWQGFRTGEEDGKEEDEKKEDEKEEDEKKEDEEEEEEKKEEEKEEDGKEEDEKEEDGEREDGDGKEEDLKEEDEKREDEKEEEKEEEEKGEDEKEEDEKRGDEEGEDEKEENEKKEDEKEEEEKVEDEKGKDEKEGDEKEEEEEGEDEKEEDEKKEEEKEEDEKKEVEKEEEEEEKEEDEKKEVEKEEEEEEKEEDEKKGEEKKEEEEEKEEDEKKGEEKEEGELTSSDEETREKEQINSEEVRCQAVAKGNRPQRNSEKYLKAEEKAKENKEESVRLGRLPKNSERKGKHCGETSSKQRDLKKKSEEKMSVAGTRSAEDRQEKSLRTVGENTREERHGRQHSSLRVKSRSMNKSNGERNVREYDGKTERKRDGDRLQSKTGENVAKCGSSGQGSSTKKIDKRDLSLKGERNDSPSTEKACRRPPKGLAENSKSGERHRASSDRGHKSHETPTSSGNKDKRQTNSLSSTSERDKANGKSGRDLPKKSRTENERKPKSESCGKKGELYRRSASDGKKEKNEGKEMEELAKTSSSLEKVDKAGKNAVHTVTTGKEISELGKRNERNLTRRGERESGSDAASELDSAKKDFQIISSNGEATETSGLEKDLTSKKQKERHPTSHKDRPFALNTRSRDGDKKSTDEKKKASEKNKDENENETKSVKERGNLGKTSSDSNTKHTPKEKSKIRTPMDEKSGVNEKKRREKEQEKESSKEKESTRKQSRDNDSKNQLPTEKSNIRKSTDEKKETNEKKNEKKDKVKKSTTEKENTSKSLRVSSNTEQLPSGISKIRKSTKEKEEANEKDKESKEKQTKSMKEKERSSTKLSRDSATAKQFPSEKPNARKPKQKTNKDSKERNRKENKSMDKKDRVNEKREDRRENKGVKNLDIKTNPLVLREISGKRSRSRDSDTTAVRPSKIRKVGKVFEKEQKAKVKTKEAKLPGKVVTVRVLKVDRDKALVLKKRHVNQLFIRGDNVIMVAYENSNPVQNKV